MSSSKSYPKSVLVYRQGRSPAEWEYAGRPADQLALMKSGAISLSVCLMIRKREGRAEADHFKSWPDRAVLLALEDAFRRFADNPHSGVRVTIEKQVLVIESPLSEAETVTDADLLSEQLQYAIRTLELNGSPPPVIQAEGRRLVVRMPIHPEFLKDPEFPV